MDALLNHPYAAFIAFIMGFNFLIFIHELGHYLAAKWAGVRATQFALFFGQALVAYRPGIGLRLGTTEKIYEKRAMEHLKAKHPNRDFEANPVTESELYDAGDAVGMNETEYRLNWIPLGGYVKMLGQEDLDPSARSDDPRSFNNKPVYKRAVIISAGVIMNIITAIVFFLIAFMQGVSFPPAVVGGTNPTAPAAITYAEGHDNNPAYRGLKPGDEILTINNKPVSFKVDGEPISDFNNVVLATALGNPNKSLAFEIKRLGEQQPLIYNLTPKRLLGSKLLGVGISPPVSLEMLPLFAGASSAVTEAGYDDTQDAQITAVNGQAIESYGELYQIATQSQARDLTFTVTQDETSFDVTARRPVALLGGPDDPAVNLLGLVPAIKINSITKDSPAAAAGLLRGDILAQIGSVDWPVSIMDIIETVNNAPADGLTIRVIRDGESLTFENVKPHRGSFGFGAPKIGLSVRVATNSNLVAQVLPDSPAAQAFAANGNIPRGSRITSINGQPVTDWWQLVDTITASDAANHELGIALRLPSDPVETATLSVDEETRTELIAASQGVNPMAMLVQVGLNPKVHRVPIQTSNPIEATRLGLVKTQQFIHQTYLTLLGLIQGRVPVEELRGPVGIVDIGTQTTQQGWTYMLFFLGLISVNLAVLNFLPIPIVDGGLMVFLIIEKIKGSPASVKVQNIASLLGLAVLGTVFLFVTYHDFMRLIGS